MRSPPTLVAKPRPPRGLLASHAGSWIPRCAIVLASVAPPFFAAQEAGPSHRCRRCRLRCVGGACLVRTRRGASTSSARVSKRLPTCAGDIAANDPLAPSSTASSSTLTNAEQSSQNPTSEFCKQLPPVLAGAEVIVQGQSHSLPRRYGVQLPSNLGVK
jgi:hypothetical protein